jgi:hypothetical protein
MAFDLTTRTLSAPPNRCREFLGPIGRRIEADQGPPRDQFASIGRVLITGSRLSRANRQPRILQTLPQLRHRRGLFFLTARRKSEPDAGADDDHARERLTRHPGEDRCSHYPRNRTRVVSGPTTQPRCRYQGASSSAAPVGDAVATDELEASAGTESAPVSHSLPSEAALSGWAAVPRPERACVGIAGTRSLRPESARAPVGSGGLLRCTAYIFLPRYTGSGPKGLNQRLDGRQSGRRGARRAHDCAPSGHRS